MGGSAGFRYKMSAAKILRLGAEERWRVGAPAQLLRKGAWHNARVMDLKTAQAGADSETHAVFAVRLRYKNESDEIRTKWVNINVAHETPLDDSLTHEFSESVTQASVAAVPRMDTDGNHFLRDVQAHMEFGAANPESLTKAVDRLRGLNVKIPMTTPKPSISQISAAIGAHLSKSAVPPRAQIAPKAVSVPTTTASAAAIMDSGCGCPDSCGCDESMCGSGGRRRRSHHHRSRAETQGDVSATMSMSEMQEALDLANAYMGK